MEVMFTKVSQLHSTSHIKFKKKYLDYTIYSWNKETINYFKKFDIDVFTASPELSYSQNIDIFSKNQLQIVIAGKLPLMYTRQCFSHIFNCKLCLNNDKKQLYNMDKKTRYNILCEDDHRIIVDDRLILNNIENINFHPGVSFRYISNDQKIEEVAYFIDKLKQKNIIPY
jgi:hypothetical protein